MAWQSVISGAAKALQGAQQAKALIGPKSKKKKGGALTVRPKFNKTVQAIEEKKAEVRSSEPILPTLQLPPAPTPKEEGPKSAGEKLKAILGFIRERRSLKRGIRKVERKDNEKKKRQEKESLRERGKQILQATGAKILAPVKSMWDTILGAVGALIEAQIMLWMIKNPKAFGGIIRGLGEVIDRIATAIIWTIDILGTITKFGYDLIDGFDTWVGETFGEKAKENLQKLRGVIMVGLNAILAGAAGLLAFWALRPRKPPRLPSGQGGNRFNKLRKLRKTRTASKAVRQRFARRFGKRAAKSRFAKQVAGRANQVSRIVRPGGMPVKRVATRLLAKTIGTGGTKTTLRFIKNWISPIVKRIPLVGSLIDFALNFFVFKDPLGKAAFKAIGAGIGTWVGGMLGTLIPVPFAGTAIGMFLGGMGGDILGGAIYEGIFGGKKENKKSNKSTEKKKLKKSEEKKDGEVKKSTEIKISSNSSTPQVKKGVDGLTPSPQQQHARAFC